MSNWYLSFPELDHAIIVWSCAPPEFSITDAEVRTTYYLVEKCWWLMTATYHSLSCAADLAEWHDAREAANNLAALQFRPEEVARAEPLAPPNSRLPTYRPQ